MSQDAVVRKNAGSARAKSPLGLTDPRVYIPVLALVLLAALPHMIESRHTLNLMNMVLLFASAGLAWNILGGYARQVSLGHGIFFGIGAYTSTLLQIHYNLTPWIGMLVGGAAAVAVGYVVGKGVFRLSGHYFAIATIAYAQLVMLLFIKFYRFTGGAEGLSVPVRDSLYWLQFGSKVPYYYIFFGFMLVMIYVTRRVQRSRLGYYMVAMGQDNQAAQAIGINIPRVKHTALAISAFCTAIAGTLFAQYMYFLDPNSLFNIPMSVEFALVSIIGGLGTVLGPVIGAFVVKPLIDILNVYFGASLPGLNYAAYGLILVLVVMLQPKGLVGWLGGAYDRIIRRLPGYRGGDVS